MRLAFLIAMQLLVVLTCLYLSARFNSYLPAAAGGVLVGVSQVWFPVVLGKRMGGVTQFFFGAASMLVILATMVWLEISMATLLVLFGTAFVAVFISLMLQAYREGEPS